MRSAPAPVRLGARDARALGLPPLPDDDGVVATFAKQDGVVRQAELEVTECGDKEWTNRLAALRQPERAELLDFSNIYPAVRAQAPRTEVRVAPRAMVAQPCKAPARSQPIGRRVAQASVQLKE